jgi:hypothetical protein
MGAALLLCLPAASNKQPFLYPDTRAYLRGAEMGVVQVVAPQRLRPWLAEVSTQEATSPAASSRQAQGAAPTTSTSLTSVQDKVVLAGRSVYYGALLYASHLAGSLWWTVAIQALCVAYLLRLLMVRLWGLGERHFLGAVAGLSAVTPLAVYTGLLMPDIFAGLSVLAVATLAAYWPRLSLLDRVALAFLLLFGVSAHASHLAVVAAMLLAGLAARVFAKGWGRLPLAAIAVVGACVSGALAAEWAFTRIVTTVVGAPPLRLPHPMARLVDMGPGTDFLQRHCSKADYAACAFVDNYPTRWVDFLFSRDPRKGAFALADPQVKRAMSAEQLRFAADVVRHDPAGVAKGLALDVLRQLVKFRVDLWGYGRVQPAHGQAGVPGDVFESMRASRSAHASNNERLTYATYLSAAAALACLLWWRRRGAGALAIDLDGEERLRRLIGVALFGVATNAVVCAVLASPFDRFQARVIWILPFLAFSAVALAYRRGPDPVSHRASPNRSVEGATP